MAYTATKVKEMLKERNLDYKEFCKWMTGQTGIFVNGEIGFFEHDVERWIQLKLNNTPTYWD